MINSLTFLLIVFLMVLALQNGLGWIALGLGAILLISVGRDFYALIAVAIAGGVLLGVMSGALSSWFILIGLFAILLILGRREEKEAQQQAAYPQLPPGYGYG